MIDIKQKFSTVQKEILLVDIEPNKWNPNKQEDKIFDKLKKSIKEHGFTCPILVRQLGDKYEIIDGEHRYRACMALGYPDIKVENMGVVEDGIAKMLTIALNNIKGQDDILKRAEILKQLNEGQLSILPWNEKEIKNELDLVNFNWEQYNKKEEHIKEKKDYSFVFSLTKAQYSIVQQSLQLTKEKDQNIALMKIVKEFLELRVNISQFGDVFDGNIKVKKQDNVEN